MSEDQCDGVCVFHDKYEDQLTEVYNWHNGAKVEIINLVEMMRSVKRWIMGLAGTVVVASIVQLIIFWPKK